MLRLSPILLVPALAACGGAKKVAPTPSTATASTTATQTQPAEKTALRVYFLRDGKVAPVLREVPKTKAVAGAALQELAWGPSAAEQALGLTTSFPAAVTADIGSVDGTLSVSPGELSRPALAQLVYTLTQFPAAGAVYVNQKRYTRTAFEDLTPPILVESPLPFETVRSPLRSTGTANTFEATFDYELVDAEGKVVSSNFVTATSGSGTRGSFDFTVPFSVDRGGAGKLVVYESSAENGQRIHVVEIPLRLER